MNACDDTELLRRFAENRDQVAFRALVERHLPLVHGAAARQLAGDQRRAEEVAQTVFALLARKAETLSNHPALAGWLFTATRHCTRRAIRTDLRKKSREQEIAIVEASSAENGMDAEWALVRPELDGALAQLSEADRDGILLRYFESRGYSEIAARFGLSENAARMRVERALEKLRGILSRRGVTSTAAALGAVISSHAAPGVAGALVAKIATGALSAAALGVGTGVVIAPWILLMNSTKAVLILAAVACGVAVYEGARARVAEKELRSYVQRLGVLESDLEAKTRELAQARQRAQAAEEDTSRLLGAIANANQTGVLPSGRETAPTKITRAEVEKRFEQAKRLAKAGQSEEAMKEYLWCLDEGMNYGFTFMGSRNELIKAMGELAKSYPPMREAMQLRRGRAEKDLLADEREMDQTNEFASLSRALGEPQRMIEVFAQLPKGDNRRGTLFNFGVFDQLLEQHRYSEVIAERPYAEMSRLFKFFQTALHSSAPVESRQEFRKDLAETQAKHVEALAGAGQLENARALAAEVLEYENSPETRVMLSNHLARAGHQDLMGPN